ncbi:hypothetical protein FPSE_05817 [Fusarium pseudograminearum CS3096]|uniref:Uncharacterized protein n=1 Tax=Fusarium pseudograminearum (strain CS3096) TaxID=1028729 RepID=K3VKS1_FUSPC|nr:hypothetical protein FPSE_05817 [Fusarium pseudograminearum CS3096]EKJ74043.1 hypothetical protein FPSE_05817 [Fusarium pseudograminearum CS3096]KAF0634834.1 hypothetical protein FPSE5266_05817 [Fusarium pseudograminearum]
MKFIFVSLFSLGLAVATPPEPVILKPLPDKANSGCYHYTISKKDRCCLPYICACKDGNFYLFNDEAWVKTSNGCNPPWGILGKSLEDIPGYCCKGWKAPKPKLDW